MKRYRNQNDECLVHTIQYTLQADTFIGHIGFEMGGNVYGLGAMEVMADCIEINTDTLTVNDCEFLNEANLDSGEPNYYRFTLTDPESGESEDFEADENELGNFIVAIEIIDARPDDLL
jgi:hypothetical protein